MTIGTLTCTVDRHNCITILSMRIVLKSSCIHLIHLMLGSIHFCKTCHHFLYAVWSAGISFAKSQGRFCCSPERPVHLDLMFRIVSTSHHQVQKCPALRKRLLDSEHSTIIRASRYVREKVQKFFLFNRTCNCKLQTPQNADPLLQRAIVQSQY